MATINVFFGSSSLTKSLTSRPGIGGASWSDRIGRIDQTSGWEWSARFVQHIHPVNRSTQALSANQCSGRLDQPLERRGIAATVQSDRTDQSNRIAASRMAVVVVRSSQLTASHMAVAGVSVRSIQSFRSNR